MNMSELATDWPSQNERIGGILQHYVYRYFTFIASQPH